MTGTTVRTDLSLERRLECASKRKSSGEMSVR